MFGVSMKCFRPLVAAALLVIVQPSSSFATFMWYNGDADQVGSLANDYYTSITNAIVYDDFVVGGSGVVINSVFSNNLMNWSAATSAFWEIRSGVSAGNGGSVVASGIGSTSQVFTGRTFSGMNEFHIQVDGLNVALSAGTYWLAVAPVGFGSGVTLVSSTLGQNAIGTPPGNNLNAFFSSTSFSQDFVPSNATYSSLTDFSMGAIGTLVTPEPSSFLLMSCAAIAFTVRRRRHTSRTSTVSV